MNPTFRTRINQCALLLLLLLQLLSPESQQTSDTTFTQPAFFTYANCRNSSSSSSQSSAHFCPAPHFVSAHSCTTKERHKILFLSLSLSFFSFAPDRATAHETKTFFSTTTTTTKILAKVSKQAGNQVSTHTLPTYSHSKRL